MAFKTTFEPEKVIQPIFTGGSIALDSKAQILASTLGEDAVLTDITTGKRLATIEGVSYFQSLPLSRRDTESMKSTGWRTDIDPHSYVPCREQKHKPQLSTSGNDQTNQ